MTQHVGPAGHADAAYLLDSAGPAAPPRDNGELVFTAPWQSQAFGVALALYDAALEGFAEAGRFADVQARRGEATAKSVRAGEEGRLDLDAAEIERSVAARARLAAL